jgi:hypothetical protein
MPHGWQFPRGSWIIQQDTPGSMLLPQRQASVRGSARTLQFITKCFLHQGLDAARSPDRLAQFDH